MKKFFLFVLAALTFAACTQNDVEELAANRADVPETLTVGFEGDGTRIQLNAAQKTVWNKGDEVSVFYGATDNLNGQFNGETGDRVGQIVVSDTNRGDNIMDKFVIVYPYNDEYVLDPNNLTIKADIPATQSYLQGSYGLNGNIMVSASDNTHFVLHSVYGWLKIQLTGNGECVERITLRGNNDEQLWGAATVDLGDYSVHFVYESEMPEDDSTVSGDLVLDSELCNKLTLDCGEGVKLGEKATAFYFAVPPQTFECGVTVVVECEGYEPMTLSTTEALTIERNHIKPMESVEHDVEPVMPNNEIHYTATAKIEAHSNYPWTFDTFGANIVSHEWNSTTNEGIVTFDAGVTTIGEDAFYNCDRLTSITIPDSVTTIGDYAFARCYSLTSVTIPDSVTTIGEYTFSSCDSLTSITIPDSVTTIGAAAFSSCDSLTKFNGKFASEDGRCLIIDGVLNSFAPAGINSYTNPDSVTTIGDDAFGSCDSLTSVTIPDSVTTIGEYTFSSCDSLTSITIPDSVTTIGYEAFFGCSSLTSITIGDGVTTIGEYTFYNCYSLTSVTIGDSVTTIGKGAFYYCSSLTSVTIGDSVTTIGEYAFYYCTSLTSVTIGDNVTTIGKYAFEYCSSLTSVTIPDSVTTIGKGAFINCDSLTSVTIGDSVTTIGDHAFWGCTSLTSVTIPDSVTTIGEYTFSSCDSLTSITIPDSVTTIGEKAFSDCFSLTSVTIGDSVTTIGDWAFAHCTSLTSVTIGDSVTTIGEYTFAGCDSLTSVTIPDSVMTIGEYAFAYCSSLTSVYCKATTPPAGGSYMFDYNASGRTIYVPKESVGDYMAAEYWSNYANYIVGYDF